MPKARHSLDDGLCGDKGYAVCRAPMLRPGKFKPSDKLIAMLKDHDYAK